MFTLFLSQEAMERGGVPSSSPIGDKCTTEDDSLVRGAAKMGCPGRGVARMEPAKGKEGEDDSGMGVGGGVEYSSLSVSLASSHDRGSILVRVWCSAAVDGSDLDLRSKFSPVFRRISHWEQPWCHTGVSG